MRSCQGFTIVCSTFLTLSVKQSTDIYTGALHISLYYSEIYTRALHISLYYSEIYTGALHISLYYSVYYIIVTYIPWPFIYHNVIMYISLYQRYIILRLSTQQTYIPGPFIYHYVIVYIILRLSSQQTYII